MRELLQIHEYNQEAMGQLLSQSTVEERREISRAIYRRVLAGERVKDIAKELGENQKIIYALIHEQGPMSLRVRVNQERDARIAGTYLRSRSITMPMLARQYNVTKQNIKAIVDRYLREQGGKPGAEKVGRTRKQRSLALGSNEQAGAR